MNVKENYVALMTGKQPEWVGNFGVDVQWFTPSVFGDPTAELYTLHQEMIEKGEDVKRIKMVDTFGITWVLDDFGAITEPGNPLLEEVGEWREKYHIPDPDKYDWDHALAEEYALLDPGKPIQLCLTGPFMTLVNTLGFENALISLVLEKEDVHALLDAMTDFQCICMKRTLERIHVDVVSFGDELSNEMGLLLSPEVYREMIKPYEKRLIDAARSVVPEMITEIHCCGKCETLLDDFVDIGCNSWQPAQPCNDLAAIKAKYGNKLIIVGGWDNVAPFVKPDITEQEIRQSVRETIDKLAPGGGYIYWDGGLVGNSEEMVMRLGWANDEAAKYGKDFYNKTI